MATDYDAPRRTESEDLNEDSLEELKARRSEAQSSSVDVDESDTAESFELPGADLSGEELSVRVIPKQADEFTCSSCFLVQHRSRLASEKNGVMICTDCAATACIPAQSVAKRSSPRSSSSNRPSGPLQSRTTIPTGNWHTTGATRWPKAICRKFAAPPVWHR